MKCLVSFVHVAQDLGSQFSSAVLKMAAYSVMLNATSARARGVCRVLYLGNDAVPRQESLGSHTCLL